jgi:RHH-type transcriptional regulator, rel operon repressor / antitoxin RelB
MLAIRLPEDVEKRLEALAKRTGRTKTFYTPGDTGTPQ